MLSYSSQARIITADLYTLEFSKDRYFLYVKNPQGNLLSQMFLYSSIHSSRGLDDTTVVGDWQVEQTAGEILLRCETTSTCWQRKTYWLRCKPDGFTYGVDVEGDGAIQDALYFGGYCSGLDRWGSGFFASGQAFLRGFTPEPNTRERIYFSPEASEGIDLNGVPVPGRDGWFFTPPPFCFAFETPAAWMGLGVRCAPGENRFVEYRYQGGDRMFHLALAYEGHTAVPGAYRLPEIGFYFARQAYETLSVYVNDLCAAGLVPELPVQPQRSAWWSAPIFCGWGAQCYLASLEKGLAPAYATQANYEQFMRELSDRRVFPGIVVIDDKWQKQYGPNTVDLQKWPDMPAFIAERHARGQKVLLWLKFWDAEGLPEDECILNAAGKRVGVDPSSPNFERHFRAQIREMLAADGLDTDGFKVDFSARIPSGPGLKIHQDLWGLELMKQYFSILHSEAKRVKPDALIIAHAPNPYLAPYIDMIRLNDVNVGKDILTAMRHRQKVASIAMPGTLIDTDNWQITDKAEWLAYLKVQPELGVPALYYSSHIDRTHEAISEDDFRQLNEFWEKYRLKVGLDDTLLEIGAGTLT